MKNILLFLAVFMPFFLFGCATKHIEPFKPENALEAGLILDQLKKTNEGLKNFKCSGSIEIKNADEVITARTVMCVSPPNSFRLEALSPAGPPAFRMSGNDINIYIQPEPGGQIYQRDSKGATLEKLAGIEIEVKDLISLLCGKPPVIPEGSIAELKKGTQDKSKKTLVIHDMTGAIIQSMDIDEKNRISGIQAYDSSGKAIYSAEFSGEKKSGKFSFPAKVFVKAGQKLMKLSLRQIWPNTNVNEDLFVLTSQPAGVKE